MVTAIDTQGQRVTIKTARGTLVLGPHGRIEGLWSLVQRELIPGEKVRALASETRRPVPRSTLIYWRKRSGFPAPVVTIKGAQPLELWSRSEVREWIKAHAARRRF